jgi:hypothetical protein
VSSTDLHVAHSSSVPHDMPLLKLFLSPSRLRGSERRRSPTTSAVRAASGAGLKVAEIGQSASEVEQEASDVTLGAFKTTLRLVKECVDGLPAPGLKGALGGVLAVLEGIEVSCCRVSKYLDDPTNEIHRLQRITLNKSRIWDPG